MASGPWILQCSCPLEYWRVTGQASLQPQPPLLSANSIWYGQVSISLLLAAGLQPHWLWLGENYAIWKGWGWQDVALQATTLTAGKYSGKASSSEFLTLMFFTRFVLLPLTLRMKRKGKSCFMWWFGWKQLKNCTGKGKYVRKGDFTLRTV